MSQVFWMAGGGNKNRLDVCWFTTLLIDATNDQQTNSQSGVESHYNRPAHPTIGSTSQPARQTTDLTTCPANQTKRKFKFEERRATHARNITLWSQVGLANRMSK